MTTPESEPEPGLVNQPTPPSVDALELTRERDRTSVNEFLEQRHPLGGVPGWKACFSARYQDSIVAVIVLSRPVSAQNDDGTELSITRFCRRPDRPANTGSWLIARGRTWARLEGFDTLAAHSGVADNYGTVYDAAGFDVSRTRQSRADDWQRRDERNSYGEYERRKWVYSL
jgi:hypothetical protein